MSFKGHSRSSTIMMLLYTADTTSIACQWFALVVPMPEGCPGVYGMLFAGAIIFSRGQLYNFWLVHECCVIPPQGFCTY